MQGLQPKGGGFQSGEKEDGKGSLTFFQRTIFKKRKFSKMSFDTKRWLSAVVLAGHKKN